MDPIYLREDEIEYELNIRGICGLSNHRRKTAALRNALEAEAAGAYLPVIDSSSRYTAISEMQTCRRICGQLNELAEATFNSETLSGLNEISSRLKHVRDRLARIKPRTLSEDEQKEALEQVVKEAIDGLKTRAENFKKGAKSNPPPYAKNKKLPSNPESSNLSSHIDGNAVAVHELSPRSTNTNLVRTSGKKSTASANPERSPNNNSRRESLYDINHLSIQERASIMEELLSGPDDGPDDVPLRPDTRQSLNGRPNAAGGQSENQLIDFGTGDNVNRESQRVPSLFPSGFNNQGPVSPTFHVQNAKVGPFRTEVPSQYGIPQSFRSDVGNNLQPSFRLNNYDRNPVRAPYQVQNYGNAPYYNNFVHNRPPVADRHVGHVHYPNPVENAYRPMDAAYSSPQRNQDYPVQVDQLGRREYRGHEIGRRENNNHYDRNREYFPIRRSVPVHQWNCRFSGDGQGLHLYDFLGQVCQLQKAERIPEAELLCSMVHLFTGRAKLWFHAIGERAQTWDDLVDSMRHEFLPANYDWVLMYEIANRAQRTNETYAEYSTHMMALFRCISMPMSEEHKLYIVQKNLLPKYSSLVAPLRISTLADLSEACRGIDDQSAKPSVLLPFQLQHQTRNNHPTLVRSRDIYEIAGEIESPPTEIDVEAIQRNQSNVARPNPRNDASNAGNMERKKPKCWNCDSEQHMNKDCREKRRIFCYTCGKVGFTCKTCPNPNCSGNEARNLVAQRGTQGPN